MHGLYLHIPFCLAKCHYCDFNSRPPLGDEEFDSYTNALIEDVRRHSDTRVDTIFLGGGTPSILSPRQIGRILDAVRDTFSLATDCEITLEMNPGTLSRDKLIGLRETGVNRLSMGVQSTHAELLARLGRQHSWAQAERSFYEAREAGFDSLNLDLMYGLPGQTVQQWESTLSACLALRPDHLSTYGLIVEEHTAFGALAARDELPLPTEEAEEAMALITRELPAAAGYRTYETSNHALPGRECRHNLLYWGNHEYDAAGAGAVSYRNGWRATRVKRPQAYVDRVRQNTSLFEFAERVDALTSLHETLTLGLRRYDGIDLAATEARYGLPTGALQHNLRDLLADAAQADLLRFEGPRVRLTWAGMRISNSIMVRLMECWLAMPDRVTPPGLEYPQHAGRQAAANPARRHPRARSNR
ncbi:MAG: radical SAM family heme chaperone HemW [Candidatus Xenobia bacterium]